MIKFSKGGRLGAAVMATLLSGTVVSSAMVVKTSAAGFSGSTTNGTNSWETGSVSLTDNDAGVAMFSTTGSTRSMGVTGTADGKLNQGDVLRRCMQVQYTGSISGNTGMNVKLYGTAGTATALAPGLDVKIQQLAGTPTDCTDGSWSTATTIYDSGVVAATNDNQLNDFTTNVGSFANGVGSWNAPTTNEAKYYRFVMTVNTAAAQSAAAEATFTWAVQ